jgi:hypothetical protein
LRGGGWRGDETKTRPIHRHAGDANAAKPFPPNDNDPSIFSADQATKTHLFLFA